MKKNIFAISAILLFFSFAVYGMGSRKAAESPAPNKNGQKDTQAANTAPDFSLTDINGETLKLSDYAGKVIILDFWATWCPPCRTEIPFFIELQEEYGKKELAVIGIAMDDESKVKSFAKEFKINYPVAAVEGAQSRQISTAYGGVRGLPTTFVIDKEGLIQRKYVGFRPKSVFEADYKELSNK